MKPLATMGCALLLAAVAAASFGPTAAGAAPAERGFAICLCLVVVLLLLGSPSAHADRGRLAGPAARLGWSFVGAFAALIWLTLFAGLSWPLGAAAATGVFCCLLLAGGSEALLVAVGVRRDHARIAVALVALLNLTAPLWLGPLATRWPHIAEATLRYGMAGYFAALLEFDVARSSWLYRQASLAGTGDSYPDPTIATLVLLAAGAAAVAIAARIRQPTAAARSTPFTPSHPVPGN